MKLTIFTSIKNGERFFDHFLNDEGFTAEEYADCARFDYELSEQEIESRANSLVQDEEVFQTCLKGVCQSDLNKFIHGAFLNDLERELISDHVTSKARKMVIDLWIQDCLFKVERKYKERES